MQTLKQRLFLRFFLCRNTGVRAPAALQVEGLREAPQCFPSGEEPPPSPAEIEAARRYAARTYFSYTPEQITECEMAGGSPVSTKFYQQEVEHEEV